MPPRGQTPADGSRVGVRAARAADADRIGVIQVAAWRRARAAALGAAADRLDPTAFAAAWRVSLAAPPSSAHRVLVAVQDDDVVGFAATAPSSGDVAEVLALEVHPDATRAGHGSRLLAACADLAREDGARTLRTWVLEDDGARAGFLAGAGLDRDGTSRLLDVDGRDVREDRWSAAL